jgi:hypothetical protein
MKMGSDLSYALLRQAGTKRSTLMEFSVAGESGKATGAGIAAARRQDFDPLIFRSFHTAGES